MKSRNVLSQIEFIIMVLVFALSAAVCLKVFAYSDSNSERNETRDYAMVRLQSAAELMKNSRGDLERCVSEFGGHADEKKWELELEDGMKLTAEKQESGNKYLGKAELKFYSSGEEICSLPVAWQEDGK